MIFDADLHLSVTEDNGLTAEAALAALDKAGIDRANIWLQPPYMRRIDDANLYIYQSAKAHPDRFNATGWVDPHFGREESMTMLKRCIEEYGMRTIKFNGAQNSFCIDSPELFPLYEYIDQSGCSLAFHIGSDCFDFTHPSRAQRVAEAFPTMNIMLVHMGGAGKPDLSNASIEVAKTCPNVMLTGSAVSYLAIIRAIDLLGPGRVCFGSDAPFALPHVERAAYEAFLPDVTDGNGYELVMCKNALRFFQCPTAC